MKAKKQEKQMKPREFWIDTLSEDENGWMEACPLREADLEVKTYSKWIHVREVVPGEVSPSIDWEKIWGNTASLPSTLKEQIQYQIEKQLRGEK